jgi:hypothetical protein
MTSALYGLVEKFLNRSTMLEEMSPPFPTLLTGGTTKHRFITTSANSFNLSNAWEISIIMGGVREVFIQLSATRTSRTRSQCDANDRTNVHKLHESRGLLHMLAFQVVANNI